MSQGDFWLQFNNGKKQQLNDIKHGVRKEQLDSKYHNLFDAFDNNSDGTLEESEFKTLANWFLKFAGNDKILDSKENLSAKSIFEYEMAIEDVDFQGFMESVSNAGAEIVSSTEQTTSDGGKEIRTEYKDGTVETIAYYSDGSYKYKKTEKPVTQTHYFVNEGFGEFEISKQEYLKKLNSIRYDTDRPKGPVYTSPIFRTDTTSHMEEHIEFSARAKMDISSRQFYLEHFIETHQDIKNALDSMGWQDDFGNFIRDNGKEFFRHFYCVINNIPYNPEMFKDKDTIDKISDVEEEFKSNYNKSLTEKINIETFNEHLEMYFKNFEKDHIDKYDMEKVAQFETLTQQYQMASILKYRIEKIESALKMIDRVQSMQSAQGIGTAGTVMVLNGFSEEEKLYNILKDIFNGDEDAVNEIFPYSGYIKDNADNIKITLN